jgi:hypothetical protein
MIQCSVAVRTHDEEIGALLGGHGQDFVGGQTEAHGRLAGQAARAHLLGHFREPFPLDALLSLQILTDAQAHHLGIGFEARHLGRGLDHMEEKKRCAPEDGLPLGDFDQPPLCVAEINRHQNFFHGLIIRLRPSAGQREIGGLRPMDTRGHLWQGARPDMRTALCIFSLALAAQAVRGQDEPAPEILRDDYAREELGVNELTAPSIQRLFTELEVFKPVPVELIAATDFDRTYNNRFQTSLNFGSLICDGFFAVVAEQQGLIQNVGRALLRQAKSLAVGQRLSARANSLLELGVRGDWPGLKLELIKTQAEVEEAMIELRDEEMAHMISLGGWLRGFEIGTIVTADNYSPQRAAGLMKPDVMDYFLERLSTLNPRLKNTELVTAITSRLQTIRKIAGDAADRAPSKSEVEQMRDLAVEINTIMSARVDQEGQIVKKD